MYDTGNPCGGVRVVLSGSVCVKCAVDVVGLQWHDHEDLLRSIVVVNRSRTAIDLGDALLFSH